MSKKKKLHAQLSQLEDMLFDLLNEQTEESIRLGDSIVNHVNKTGGASSAVLTGAAIRLLLTSSEELMDDIQKPPASARAQVHSLVITALCSIMIATAANHEKNN